MQFSVNETRENALSAIRLLKTVGKEIPDQFATVNKWIGVFYCLRDSTLANVVNTWRVDRRTIDNMLVAVKSRDLERVRAILKKSNKQAVRDQPLIEPIAMKNLALLRKAAKTGDCWEEANERIVAVLIAATTCTSTTEISSLVYTSDNRKNITRILKRWEDIVGKGENVADIFGREKTGPKTGVVNENERSVLRFFGTHITATNQQAAEHCGISVSTVEKIRRKNRKDLPRRI